MNSYIHQKYFPDSFPYYVSIETEGYLYYDPRCIMSSAFMFDDIIMNIIRNNKLALHNEENDCLFTNIKNNVIYMYRGSLQ